MNFSSQLFIIPLAMTRKGSGCMKETFSLRYSTLYIFLAFSIWRIFLLHFRTLGDSFRPMSPSFHSLKATAKELFPHFVMFHVHFSANFQCNNQLYGVRSFHGSTLAFQYICAHFLAMENVVVSVVNFISFSLGLLYRNSFFMSRINFQLS